MCGYYVDFSLLVAGDILIFSKLDRAFRNIRNALNTLHELKHRVKQIQKAKGKFLGGFTRFGYKAKGDRLVPNPAEQKIIEEMRDLKRRGASLRRISYWLGRIYGIQVSHATVSSLIYFFEKILIR
jgi:DNA invertase Pin-like site-specific DNA recombinase